MNSSLILAAVLLMLVAVLVLVLVLMEGNKKKRKKLAEEVSIRSTLKSSAVPAGGDRHPVKPALETPDSVCIYAYTPRKAVRRCSACDGENPVSCSRCMICGCEMSPMGR